MAPVHESSKTLTLLSVNVTSWEPHATAMLSVGADILVLQGTRLSDSCMLCRALVCSLLSPRRAAKPELLQGRAATVEWQFLPTQAAGFLRPEGDLCVPKSCVILPVFALVRSCFLVQIGAGRDSVCPVRSPKRHETLTA